MNAPVFELDVLDSESNPLRANTQHSIRVAVASVREHNIHGHAINHYKTRREPDSGFVWLYVNKRNALPDGPMRLTVTNDGASLNVVSYVLPSASTDGADLAARLERLTAHGNLVAAK